jgi:hypothetical protein
VNALQSGVRVKTLLTNSRLTTMGSGVALVGPDMKFDYSVNKTLRGSMTVGLAQLEGAKIKNNADLIVALETACRTLVGQTFGPKENVLQFKSIVLIQNNNYSPILVNSYSVAAMPGTERVQVKLGVSLFDSQAAMKLRGPGVKATTLPYDVTISYLEYGQVVNSRKLGNEVLLNNEVRKGNYLLVSAFCESLKDSSPHISTEFGEDGQLYLVDSSIEISSEPVLVNNAPHGYPEEWEEVSKVCYQEEVINLLLPDNKVVSWADKQIKKAKLSFKINKAFYDNAAHQELFSHADVTATVLDSKTVLIEEQVDILECHIVYSLEVSTPKENIGTSALILEQMLASIAMYPAFSKFWIKGSDARQTILDFCEYASNRGEDTSCLKISLDQMPNILADLSETVLVGKQLMKAMEQLAKMFTPSGTICFTSVNEEGEEAESYVNFPSLIKLVAYEAGGVVATGIAETVETLLRYSVLENSSSVEGYVNRRHSLLKQLDAQITFWIESLCDSKGVMKSLARTSNLCHSGKVKTSLHPELCPDENNLPVVILHPDCPLVRNGKVQPGDILGISRSPMPFMVMVKAKLSLEVGLIGHIMVDPTTWAKGNGGDSDGDPAVFINITENV